MPFPRDDSNIEERMQVVTAVISQPDRYGLVSQLAREYDLSRPSRDTMLHRGREGLAASLLPRPPGRAPLSLPRVLDKNRLDRASTTFTIAGHARLEGVQICLEEAFDLRRSLGDISGVLDRAGTAAHANLAQLCPAKPIRADLDAIFRGSTPHPTLIDHDSTRILALRRADRRDSTPWGGILLDQAAKGIAITGAASEGAVGIIGGIAESGVVAVRLGDLFHVVRDLMVVAGQLEKAADAAIGREEQARRVEAEAQAVPPRRGPKRKAVRSGAEAGVASQRALGRDDDYVWLIQVMRETLEPVDARTGRLRSTTGSRQGWAAVVSLLREWADERVTKVAGRLERAIPDLVAYQEVLARQMAPWVAPVGEETVALIAWAWRHRRGLGRTNPAARAAAFPAEQHAPVTAIWTSLGNAHRGSSLVEWIHSLLRPHPLVHRGADQGFLDLLAGYFNHRVFSRGKRQGTSPIQLAGLTAPDDGLASVGFAPKRRLDELQAPKPTEGRLRTQSVNRLVA